MTKDGKTLVIGRTLDLTEDPYKKNWSKVNLANAPTKGAADAKVTLVEYTDFQCPFCSRAHNTLEDVLKQYEGKVKLTYKSLPLNIHPWAEDAAVAGVCIYQQGGNDAFWKITDYFFQNQQSITKDTLKAKVLEFAKTANVDADKLTKCMDDKATLPTIQADQAEAQALGFNSTPSFLVNGRPIVGALAPEEFKKVLDEAVANASSAPNAQ